MWRSYPFLSVSSLRPLQTDLRQLQLLVAVVLLAGLAVFAVACGGDDDAEAVSPEAPAEVAPEPAPEPVPEPAPPPAEDAVVVELLEQDGSGISGTATLTPTEAGLLVTVQMVGEPRAGELESATIRTGICEDTTVLNVFDEIGGIPRETRTAEREISATLADLQDGNHHIEAGGIVGNDFATERVNACGAIPVSDSGGGGYGGG